MVIVLGERQTSIRVRILPRSAACQRKRRNTRRRERSCPQTWCKSVVGHCAHRRGWRRADRLSVEPLTVLGRVPYSPRKPVQTPLCIRPDVVRPVEFRRLSSELPSAPADRRMPLRPCVAVVGVSLPTKGGGHVSGVCANPIGASRYPEWTRSETWRKAGGCETLGRPLPYISSG